MDRQVGKERWADMTRCSMEASVCLGVLPKHQSVLVHTDIQKNPHNSTMPDKCVVNDKSQAKLTTFQSMILFAL